MLEIQREPWPAIWIVAPVSISEYFYVECLKDNGGNFYYHQSSKIEEDKQFYLITNEDLPRLHHTKKQKITFSLS
jgi:hypothetical protein